MRAFVPDSSPPTRRRRAHLRIWVAAVAASILLATLAATAATMAADDRP
jgi:hypothetical protein